MFRDIHIINQDFSLRIQLGLAIFRWWRPLTNKDVKDGTVLYTWLKVCVHHLNLYTMCALYNSYLN